VGLASARVAGDWAWADLIAIAPDWRRQGIGSALTRALENRLLQRGVRKISALFNPGNVGEQALVNRGYSPTKGMILYEKLLSYDPSEVRIIDKWGGQILDSDMWEQLAGMEQEKALIEQRIVAPLSDPILAAQIGLKLPGTVLMFGPPGTGKTTFAKALASRLKWPFVELLPSKLSSGGGTLANELREALQELAQLDHAVIFIDEFDEIAPARESRPMSAGVVNELLKSIPELRQRAGKLLVCATNFVETIDPAVLRPGRFDLPIGIGPPNVTALIALWRQALSSMRTTNDLDAATLAEKCLGFTPGDVELAAQRAAASAFIRARERKEEALISADDLLAAISRTKPSVTPEMFSTFNIELEAFQRI